MEYFEWSYSGIDLSIEGTGGEGCVNYLPVWQRLIESVSVFCLSFGLFSWSWARLTVPLPLPSSQVTPRNGELEHNNSPGHVDAAVPCQLHHDWPGRRLALLIHSLTFGVEIGFKLSSRTMLWLFNPCHVVTAVQLLILSAPPSPLITSIFRLHLHMLNGPIVAIVFPVVNTRTLPLEQFIYYAQHILIIVIPYFLLRQGRLFNVEKIGDFSWTVLSIAIQSVYHFIILQALGMMTQVNLDNMLCPAISDPFRGRCYRLWALAHQSALVLIFGKSLTMVYSSLMKMVGENESDEAVPERKFRFAEFQVAKNLSRLLEAIPEPSAEFDASSEPCNGRLKAL